MDHTNIKHTLATISIRGRVAYGTACLEAAYQALHLHDPDLQSVIDYYWSYTSAIGLDDWEADLPPVLQEAIVVLKDYYGFSSHDPYSKVYLRWPLAIVIIIAELSDVGRSNLYGGIVGHSELTLEPALHIVSILNDMQIPLPEVQPFLKTRFDENNGWGNRVDRSFFDK